MPPANGGYQMLNACQKALLHKWSAPGKSSTIYKEVIGQTMPPKSSGISFLTKEESDFLVRWIDAGKPEF